MRIRERHGTLDRGELAFQHPDPRMIDRTGLHPRGARGPPVRRRVRRHPRRQCRRRHRRYRRPARWCVPRRRVQAAMPGPAHRRRSGIPQDPRAAFRTAGRIHNPPRRRRGDAPCRARARQLPRPRCAVDPNRLNPKANGNAARHEFGGIAETAQHDGRLSEQSAQEMKLGRERCRVENGRNVGAGFHVLPRNEVEQRSGAEKHNFLADGAALRLQGDLGAAEGEDARKGPAGEGEDAVGCAGGQDQMAECDAARAMARHRIRSLVAEVPHQGFGKIIDPVADPREGVVQGRGLRGLRSVEIFRGALVRHEPLAIDLPAARWRFIDDDRSDACAHEDLGGTDAGRAGADDQRSNGVAHDLGSVIGSKIHPRFESRAAGADALAVACEDPAVLACAHLAEAGPGAPEKSLRRSRSDWVRMAVKTVSPARPEQASPFSVKETRGSSCRARRLRRAISISSALPDENAVEPERAVQHQHGGGRDGDHQG